MITVLPSLFLPWQFPASQKSTLGQGVATAWFHAFTAIGTAVGNTTPGSGKGVDAGVGAGVDVGLGVDVGVGVDGRGPIIGVGVGVGVGVNVGGGVPIRYCTV